MPARRELPESLAKLAEHLAVRLSDTSWAVEMDWLIKTLDPIVGHRRDRAASQTRSTRPSLSPFGRVGPTASPAGGPSDTEAGTSPDRRGPAADLGPSSDAETAVRIFINYRHEDTSGHAGRLYDKLTDRFGEESVFIDFDKIRPGRHFVEEIDEHLSRCDVFLALIGRSWLTTTDRNGRRRLDDPEDTLSLELEAALRQQVPIIPLLVQDAQMPTRADLPEALASFARRQAFPLSDRRWRAEVGQLVEELERLRTEKGAAG